MSYRDILSSIAPLDDVSIDQISPEMMDTFLHTKGKLESGNRYGLVNRDPGQPDSGFNVGAAQWRNSRATNLMERLYNTDPELAKQYLGDIDKFTYENVWPNKDKVASWLGTDTGARVQQQQMRDDFKNIYIAKAKEFGIKSAGAAMVWADLAHRWGVNGAKRFINPNGETTVGFLAGKLDELAREGNRNDPINKRRFSEYAKAFGGNAGAIMAMHQASTSVLKGGDTVASVAEAFDYADPVDIRKIISEASASPKIELPEIPRTHANLPMTEEVSVFRNQLMKEVLNAKPQENTQPDPWGILLNAIIKYLIGGV